MQMQILATATKKVCKLLPGWVLAKIRGIYMQMCKHFAPYSRRHC